MIGNDAGGSMSMTQVVLGMDHEYKQNLVCIKYGELIK